jgi:hypothetical protein
MWEVIALEIHDETEIEPAINTLARTGQRSDRRPLSAVRPKTGIMMTISIGVRI